MKRSGSRLLVAGLLVALGALALLPSAFASWSLAAKKPDVPDVGPIVATFANFTTTYKVSVSDATGEVDYSWRNTNSCGDFDPIGRVGRGAAWEHPDENNPKAQDFHDGPCPAEPVHPGKITVVVSDANYRCALIYSNGSAPGTTGTEAASCHPREKKGPGSGSGSGSGSSSGSGS